ncbi:MAG: thioredoxin domain-containing protein [Bacteroidota bacterium]
MNRLISESSPYLLQHANNPVNWYPYGEEALAEASASNRPLLISIGYSACHWCHVMEHESFSQPEIAEVMNRNFVCIKVDREERPDVDHVYMGAVQMLHGNGGWPLNCFALPDGRPFWGGTYFRPDHWLDLLNQISNLYRKSKTDLEAQADRILLGINDMNIIRLPGNPHENSMDLVNEAYNQLSLSFDTESGGLKGAPKFPMPVVWQFVLAYHRMSGNQEAIIQVETTLYKMACGGIFDQIGGGFSRYSADTSWKVPHFEKMLYDNAQLISLYTNIYRLTKEKFYAEIFELSIDFVFRELTSSEGLFYSALDADSDGKEGLFYLWTRGQIKELLPEYADLLADYWGIDAAGLWEQGKSILLRPGNDALFASQQHLSEEELKQLLRMAGNVLYAERNKRIHPSLDDKVILSWNALMIKALADAFKARGSQRWLDAALNAGQFINERFYGDHGGLKRVWKNGKCRINAFLDDYVYLADAYIALYQITFDEVWLQRSESLVEYVFSHFSDTSGPLFWYSPDTGSLQETTPVVARIIGTTDGVEPSGNAVFAGVLLALGHYLGKQQYLSRAMTMTGNLQQRFLAYPAAYAAWARQALEIAYDTSVLVITGPDALKNAAILNRKYLPGTLIAASCEKSGLELFRNRFATGKNLIYRCQGNTCEAPVGSVVDLLL